MIGSFDALLTAPLRVVRAMRGASNRTLLVEAEGSGLAIYKPSSGEAPLWDYPPGTLHRREVAAYEMSRALGWPAVPATVLRDGPEGPGAVQGLVDAIAGEHFFTLREQRLPEFVAFALFDALINNGDRKSGHCLLGKDGVIWGIDHGVSLGVEPNLRTVIWEFAGEPIPADLAADLERVRAELHGDELGSRITRLLSAKETAAAVERAEALLEAGRLPEPGPARPFPWPLV